MLYDYMTYNDKNHHTVPLLKEDFPEKLRTQSRVTQSCRVCLMQIMYATLE